jgi:peptidylprolyl isomerase
LLVEGRVVAGQVGSKKARRQAAKEHRRAAAAARARARRRSQIMLATLAGLAVVGIVVAITLLVRSGGDDAPGAAPSAAASPSAGAAAFPPLPAGADPALATKPVVSAGEGDVTALKVTTLIEGTGPAAQNGRTLQVNYVGVTYKDGAEFDASWSKQQTLPVTLGSGGVIKGWDEGLVGVKQGSRVQLDIPADKAYGEPAPQGYPSGDLRFVVDVLSVT